MAAWFPYADEETLRQLAYFVGWMFLIDDEIDQVSGPNIDDPEAFEKLHDDTLEFVRRSLELDGQSQPPTAENPTIESFRFFGEALCERCTVGKLIMPIDCS